MGMMCNVVKKGERERERSGLYMLFSFGVVKRSENEIVGPWEGRIGGYLKNLESRTSSSSCTCLHG